MPRSRLHPRHARGRRRVGARRVRRRREPVLQRPKRRAPRGTSSPTSSRRWCSAATFAHPREIFAALGGVRGHHMAKAARRDGGVGSLARGSRASAARRACWAATAIVDRLGRVDRHPGFARRARRASRDRARGRLPPHQDQDQAGLGRRRGRARPRPLRRHPADGGRQRRLHAGGRRAPRRARSRST